MKETTLQVSDCCKLWQSYSQQAELSSVGPNMPNMIRKRKRKLEKTLKRWPYGDSYAYCGKWSSRYREDAGCCLGCAISGSWMRSWPHGLGNFLMTKPYFSKLYYLLRNKLEPDPRAVREPLPLEIRVDVALHGLGSKMQNRDSCIPVTAITSFTATSRL